MAGFATRDAQVGAGGHRSRFGQFRAEMPRLLGGVTALSTVHESRGRVLHVWSFGCHGTVERWDGLNAGSR